MLNPASCTTITMPKGTIFCEDGRMIVPGTETDINSSEWKEQLTVCVCGRKHSNDVDRIRHLIQVEENGKLYDSEYKREVPNDGPEPKLGFDDVEPLFPDFPEIPLFKESK